MPGLCVSDETRFAVVTRGAVCRQEFPHQQLYGRKSMHHGESRNRSFLRSPPRYLIELSGTYPIDSSFPIINNSFSASPLRRAPLPRLHALDVWGQA